MALYRKRVYAASHFSSSDGVIAQPVRVGMTEHAGVVVMIAHSPSQCLQQGTYEQGLFSVYSSTRLK
jgi:hypothetical protein